MGFPMRGNLSASRATPAHLHQSSCREELFTLINKLPTCYEVVSGRATVKAGGAVLATAGMKRPGPAMGPGAGSRPPARQARVSRHSHTACLCLTWRGVPYDNSDLVCATNTGPRLTAGGSHAALLWGQAHHTCLPVLHSGAHVSHRNCICCPGAHLCHSNCICCRRADGALVHVRTRVAPDPPGPQPQAEASDEDEDGQSGSAGWEDGEGDPCPACGRLYRTEEFWIACDSCDTWYCGRCAKMTEAKAQKTKQWKCNQCAGA